MKRIMILLMVLWGGLLLGLSACGTEEEDNPTVQTFMDGVRTCMPYLGEGTSDVWSEEDPAGQGSIISRLFDPEKGGDDCLFTHIEMLDTNIEMINTFSDLWDIDGTYTNDGLTLTVDTSVSSVGIPYLGGFFSDFISVSVDREVVLESPDGLTVHMAFAITDDSQEIVQQYERDSTEAGVYYALINDGFIGVWHARIRGDSLVQIMWEGSVDEQIFRITVCTNHTGNWEVMGGGSIESLQSRMAFMARNDATDNSRDEYYFTISYQDLLAGVEQEIFNADTTPPDGSGELAYITEGNAECLGFLGIGQFPRRLEDLDWVR